MNKDNIDNSWLVITPDDKIIFYFNEDILSRIGKFRKKRNNLSIDLELFKKGQAYLKNNSKFLSEGLSFCSFYQGIPIIRTVIYPDGKIYNQVNNHYIEYSQLLENISASHFWSVEQLLIENKLNIRKNWSDWFTWGIAIAFVTITVITNLDRLIANIWLWLLIPVALWLLQWGFSRLFTGRHSALISSPVKYP